MSLDNSSRSRSRSRSRSPMDRKIRTQHYPNRVAPYRRESRRGFSENSLCNNCRRPGHFARECPNAALCHNCGLPGHIASECNTRSLCWNCREPGHMAGNCPNEGICHTCGKAGHRARDCTAPPGDLRLCNNCYKQGHMAADCTNDRACKNCRKPGHIARDCQNDPVCNTCNISGHMSRDCPKGYTFEERGAGARGGGFRDIVCRTCQQVGHMSRDCISMTICHNCGGRGHMAFECPSGGIYQTMVGIRSHTGCHYFVPHNITIENIFRTESRVCIFYLKFKYSRSFRKIRCDLVKYIRLSLGRPDIKSRRRKKFFRISFSKN